QAKQNLTADTVNTAQKLADTLALALSGIQGVHQPAQSLADQINAAQAQLTQTYQGVQNDIKADSTLKDSDKASQNTDLDSRYQQAQKDLANAGKAQLLDDLLK
ncbi:hypothetical protein, partial [Fructobacillus ficulneus]|uniref:hypothetical protein n=1 Tax=Fructobacillus ficulneus TaxID=157463 RepID=UPI000AF08A4C